MHNLTLLMSLITKPMLACNPNSNWETNGIGNIFPVLATPKIDGIRALKINGCIVSRSFNLIPNLIIRKELEQMLPDGADGEIVSGDTFYTTSSVVMSINYNVNNFVYYWFDWVIDSLDVPYIQRINKMVEYANSHTLESSLAKIIVLVPDIINNQQILNKYEKYALKANFEGVILRKPDGKYKCRRSTLSEQLLIKLKRCNDSEAIIIGTEELMHNNNTPEYNNIGYAIKSSHKTGLVAGNTLGSIIAQTKDGIIFKIGSGFTNKLRTTIWNNRENIIGQYVKYKHLNYGSLEAPRSPVFVGIRHQDDMN